MRTMAVWLGAVLISPQHSGRSTQDPEKKQVPGTVHFTTPEAIDTVPPVGTYLVETVPEAIFQPFRD